MKSLIDRFEPTKQEFSPKKLRKYILSMDMEQLKKLNKYITGDEMEHNPEHYQTREDYLDNPIIYLTELCFDQPQIGSRFLIEYDNIWEHRFDYQDQIERILDINWFE